MNIKQIMLFTMVLLVGLTVVSAADIIDADATDVAVETPQVEQANDIQEIVQETVQETDNGENEEITDTCTCTGRTYSNPISITPENYASQISHIYDTGYDAVEFSGTFTSTLTGGSITITNPTILSSISGATFEDTQFIINSDDVTIKNLIIENDDNAYGAAITATGYKNLEVINNTLTVTKTTTQETIGIKIANSNNTTVCKNIVNVSAVPQSMGWDNSTGVWLGAVQISGILYSNVNNSRINCNTVTVNDSTSFTAFGWSTADGITVKGGSENTTVNNNNVNVTGSEYNYGISLSEFVKNITVYNNIITMETINQLCGIQLSAGTDSTIKANKIYGNCTTTYGTTASYEAFSYGIVISTATYGASDCESYNNTIEDNEITLNSTISYGIQLNNVKDTNVTNNTVNVTGNVVMDLGIYNSSYVEVTDNTFYSTGNTITLHPYIYDAIYPTTTGIKINETSNNILIENNDITVTDSASGVTSYAVILEDCNDSEVENNNLLVNSLTTTPPDYDNLVLNNGSNNYIYNP